MRAVVNSLDDAPADLEAMQRVRLAFDPTEHSIRGSRLRLRTVSGTRRVPLPTAHSVCRIQSPSRPA